MIDIFSPVILNIIKILVAMLCGGLIGLERTRDQKPAGVRTLMLVALGAALFMVVSLTIGMDGRLAPGPIMTGAVIGIGLLGAGAMIRVRELIPAASVAASVWVTAAIGLAIGAGLFIEGIFITIITYLVLGWLHRFLKV